MANIKQTVKLGVFTLAIMNVTAVVSLRGLPAEAVYGMSSAFYYLFAAIVFLIPTSLVAAELAAMFQDKQGGVFRWVGEAYGKKLGFLAIWVQWIESTSWYHVTGQQQVLLTRCCPHHLLASYVHFHEGHELGR